MIQDIFIHEALKGFEVRFYLAVVVEGEEEVVVVFPVRIDREREIGRGLYGDMAYGYIYLGSPSETSDP